MELQWERERLHKKPSRIGEIMPASKAQQKAVNKYRKNNYDLVQLTMPKGQKDTIKAHAAVHGESVNAFINRAIDEAMECDGSAAEKSTRACRFALQADILETAQQAAEATGETVSQFISRAVETQAKRDQVSLRMGVNPSAHEKD